LERPLEKPLEKPLGKTIKKLLDSQEPWLSQPSKLAKEVQKREKPPGKTLLGKPTGKDHWENPVGKTTGKQ
jgi:hypothetical protein